MLMTAIDDVRAMPAYPELAGKRVLITGLTSTCGVDIVRAFAEHKGRLVLQLAEQSEATETIAEIAAPSALEIKAFGPIGAEADAVTRFAQGPAQVLGGLDSGGPAPESARMPGASVAGRGQGIRHRFQHPKLGARATPC